MHILSSRYFIAATAMILSLSTPVLAQDQDYVSLSTGIYDVGDDEDTAEIRLEYRWGEPCFYDVVKPWVGGEVTAEGSVWAGGGLLADFAVTDSFYLTPSFGVGLYAKGSSDLDLDFPIEFRSQLEAAYKFENNHRAGIAFGHISNASIGDDNPGTEILSAYWHIPVN